MWLNQIRKEDQIGMGDYGSVHLEQRSGEDVTDNKLILQKEVRQGKLSLLAISYM